MAQYEPITQEHEPPKRQEMMSYDDGRIRAAEAYAMEEMEDETSRSSTNRTSLLSTSSSTGFSLQISHSGPPEYGDDEHPLDSEPLLFNGFSSARDHPAGYADGRNSSEAFDHLLPEGEGAKSTLMAGIANVSPARFGDSGRERQLKSVGG
jgi:hypothetical protein